jgi:hypothetical protein
LTARQDPCYFRRTCWLNSDVFAVEHLAYLKNRIPTAALPFGEGKLSKTVTPFKAYKEALPDLTRLRVLGCAAMPNNTKEKHPKKFDPWFKPGYLFIGMQSNKIYKLFNSVTQVVEKYGDADFDE